MDSFQYLQPYSPVTECLLLSLTLSVDNWALIYAQQLALEEKLPLHICFCLVVPQNSELATIRHFGFMLRGLEEVAKVEKPSIVVWGENDLFVLFPVLSI